MEFISSLIPLFIIISIIFSIVNKAKQAQNKSSKPKPASSGTQNKSLSLQEIIRRQIEEQKNAMNPAGTQQTPPHQPASQAQPMAEGNFANTDSLENRPTEMQRHSHGVHISGAYNEGDALKRATLEGEPTEMQRYARNIAGGGYNEGDALNRNTLEGSPIYEYEDKFSLDEEVKVSRRSKKTPKQKSQKLSSEGFKGLKINANSIVSGIIMSEVLGSRGGRRAAK